MLAPSAVMAMSTWTHFKIKYAVMRLSPLLRASSYASQTCAGGAILLDDFKLPSQ